MSKNWHTKNKHNKMRLDQVCNLITDGKHGDCQNEDGSGYYFLSAKDVKDGKLNYEGARQITCSDFIDTHRRTQLEPLDLLLSNSGTIGRMAIAKDVENTYRTTFQKSVAILKPNKDQLNPYWFYYCLQNEADRLIAVSGGTAQKNLLLRDLRAFEIAIPTLSTQQHIASILSAYDDLIENNTRRIAVLEEMARLIYQEWFVNFRFPGHEKVKMIDSELGLIPEGWEATKLEDLATDMRESVLPNEVPADTPYVGLEHIPRRSITLKEWGLADNVASMKLRFKPDDILFGKIRPYFHKISIAPICGICSSDVIVIQAKKPEWLMLVLACVSHDQFVEHATQTSNGTKMPRANWNVLLKYPLPLPPPDILEKFNAVLENCVGLARILMLKITNLRTQRDMLLPKLISGEIDVSNIPKNLESAAA